MKTKTVNGTYGGFNRPCMVIVAEDYDGGSWYCVEGSQNINLTYDTIEDGVDVELLSDVDCFTWSSGISDEDELIEAVEG